MANAVAHFTADLLSLRQTTNESLGLNERNIFLFNPNKNMKNMKKKEKKNKRGKGKIRGCQVNTIHYDVRRVILKIAYKDE
jgi:hypothetical protein